MQTVSVNYANTIKKNVSLAAKCRLIAEWNHNRFAGPVDVINTGQTNADSDEFPLESIVATNRPEKDGILKGRATAQVSWAAAGKPTVEGYAQSGYDDSALVTGQRSYTVSQDSKYKYWTTPTQSGTTLAGGGYDIASGGIELTYAEDIWANKITAIYEASANTARDVTVFYKTTAAGAWTQITGTFQIDPVSGRLDLYRQANGTWSATEYLLNPILIRGIKVVAAKTGTKSAYLSVIEISARLRQDLSAFVIDYSDDFSMSEPSLVTPLGTCSSNQGSINLSNIDGRFDNDRTNLLDTGVANLYYGLIDKNVRIQMEVGLDVLGSTEWTRAFTMWTDEWGSQNQETVSVTVKDSSKQLQEAKPNASLYRGLTTAGIVWRLCDSVGFNNYNISAAALNDNHFIDYYWTDPEKTVWEHFAALAQATQTAIFFDEFDVLQVLPRSAAYDLTRPVSWTFDGEYVPDGPAAGRPTADTGKLADIIDLEQTYDYEANIANVKYIPTDVAPMVDNIAPMEQAWAPDGDVVLRASRLVQNCTSTDTAFRITSAEAKLWPYTGIIQVEGEMIRYVSKSYSYRNAGGTWTSAYIDSEEKRAALDAQNPALSFANYFNGYMFAGTANRGLWGSVPATHLVDISGWYYNHYRTTSGAWKAWNGGLVENKQNGTMSLVTNKTFTANTWYAATRGNGTDQRPIWYGTRLRFPTSGYGYGAAGLVIAAGTNDSGFYVELVRTKAIDAVARAKWTNELCFYVRYSNGSIKRIGVNGGKGTPFAVGEGVWYDLDVKIEASGSNQVVTLMLNGVVKNVIVVPAGSLPDTPASGRYGLFTRGWTSAEFEYYYASTYSINDSFDQQGWFDRVQGGYQSSQYDREWVYQWRTATRVVKKKTYKYNQRFAATMMDEFGPVVHEVREYDVKFDKTVLNSQLYISNDKQIICPEYVATPFGAKFLLANSARVNAIANGEDTLMFGIDNPVTQKMLVYGRTIVKGDEATVTVRNEAAVNRRGGVEIDISSEWIQSKTAATEIGNWITLHWGGGNDEVKITATGNPLLQLGDVIAVSHPDKSMTYVKNRYFVVGISHSFDGALESTFTLRRVKA